MSVINAMFLAVAPNILLDHILRDCPLPKPVLETLETIQPVMRVVPPWMLFTAPSAGFSLLRGRPREAREKLENAAAKSDVGVLAGAAVEYGVDLLIKINL